MATNNPNVPADQAKAATNSAPNAQVSPAQPVQMSSAASQSTGTGSVPQQGQPQVSSQSGSNGQAGSQSAASQSSSMSAKPGSEPQPVDGNKRMQTSNDKPMSDDPEGKKQEIDKMRQEEQKVGDELDAANSKSDYFQQVANDDAVFNDPTRQEHQRMRAQEADLKKGDPTRDPVAKQEAMDMNTPQPGAKEEAEEISKGEDPDARNLG